MGYANRSLKIEFPELSEPGDPIWVTIRNPRLMTQSELRPRDVEIGADGVPTDLDEAQEAMFETLARLIIGCKVYDASDLSLDTEGNEIGGDELIPTPVTPASIGKFPAHILKRLTDEITEALNPR